MAVVNPVAAKPLAAAAIAQLEADGVATLIGTVVNPAGLTHAKTVPLRRMGAFADPGLGASPVWHAFTIDHTGIVYGRAITPVGDQRIRIDLGALRILGDGLAWAPGMFFNQDGTPDPFCSRGALSRVQNRLADEGLTTVVGHEMEFVLVGPDGARLPSHLWAQYGLAGVLEFEGFVRDVTNAATASGVAIEQFHPEYGANQFEISLAPLPPVAAADALMLTRIIVGRVARQYGMRVSLSPVPFAGGVGSGAHQHFSMKRGETELFFDGAGANGMTREGESAIAGLVAGLPEAQGVLAGSVLSGQRMQPGNWAGAYVCWGTENREASVRYLIGGPSNPYGANIEVKVVDPSANPYFATAAILGLALDGIERGLPLPPETTVDPATLTDAQRGETGVVLLCEKQTDALDVLNRSSLMRRILGDEAVDAVVAVRRYEHDNYGALSPEEITDKFRLAWSV
ncbi:MULTISPECIES: glutamine synthetase family protein [unclassified Mycobacterium]|uniref:glutamine synthetase family protein n=1 Tax=unclassified Mycobacterium TaxID=2642494 RepID=UPI00073FE564|nr:MULTISPECIES: glutamine synthetase family protein [unclassified Mycobacterium]KUH88724.1 glutamine synthetase [Mycobacterium sp. GA-0227b]KUH91018.1 glutamine synthetase [Mycobacterium sp. GA-1999]KUH95371.1 glutamine synthetase [Mycobacterium sp. IS-1556]